MRYIRIHAGPDGESHLEEVDTLAAVPVAGVPARTQPLPAKALIFRRAPHDERIDWHPAPRSQFSITLSGDMEIETSDGQVRRLGGPGGLMLAEDLGGKGHLSTMVGGQDRLSVTVVLDGPAAAHAAGELTLPDVSSTGPSTAPMKYLHLYATPDGESHFEEAEAEAVWPPEAPAFSRRMRADTVGFMRMPVGHDAGIHNAPRRQFVITLAGQAELTASDGEVRRVGPGSIMLAEDTAGKGHRTVVTSDTERWMMIVTLAD